jgi:hypothetical protein
LSTISSIVPIKTIAHWTVTILSQWFSDAFPRS